jgi:hypothetical protein
VLSRPSEDRTHESKVNQFSTGRQITAQCLDVNCVSEGIFHRLRIRELRMQKKCKIQDTMLQTDAAEIKRNLMDQAECAFGRERALEIQQEIDLMANQLAMLRSTPVELQDEP